MNGDPAVVALVVRARDGDQKAWDELTERFAPLVWSICRRYRLSAADAEDVGQTVWLLVVEHLSELREPARLPGWIATTTQRECLRVWRSSRASLPSEDLTGPGDMADGQAVSVEDEVLAHERYAALRAAFAQLPSHCQELLSMLLRDPPVPYGEVGRILDLPIGSIGPNRGRCLQRLRRCPAFAALREARPELGKNRGDRGTQRAERGERRD